MQTTNGLVSLHWDRACERCSLRWLYVYKLEKRREEGGGGGGGERERRGEREGGRRREGEKMASVSMKLTGY